MALNADTLARTLADLDRRLRGVERASQSARTSVETSTGETLVLADAAERGAAAAEVAATAQAAADDAAAAATDAQAAADAAQSAADAVVADVALIPDQIAAAKAEAISTAATDAQGKADAAEAAATAAAALDAQAKADAAKASALALAATDAQSRADAAEAQAVADATAAAAATAQTKADLAQAAAINAAMAYTQSRGTDLITNGSGITGDATNFSTYFTFDPLDAPVGASGSFVAKSALASSAFTEEFQPYDPTKPLRLSFKMRQTVAGAVSKAYGFLAPYDGGGASIGPAHYMRITGTETTLAAPLNPGDTTITLTSAANWYGTAAKPAGAASYFRSIQFWDYVDTFGKAWPAYSYTRNVLGSDQYADGGVNSSTGVITLNAPYSGPAKAAGTPVSQPSAGGSYMYMPSLTNGTVPEAWTTYADTHPGGVFPSASQAVPGTGGATWTTGMPPGTAKLKTGWLLNYAPTSGRHAVAAVSLSDASAASYAANNITSVQITDNAITAPKITAGAVIAGKIATDAVTATTIAAGAVVAGKLAADSVLATNIKAGEITAAKLAAGTITAASGVIGDIDAAKITVGKITAAQMATGTITAASGVIGSIDAAKITVGTISAAQLAADAIDGKTITGAVFRTAASGERIEIIGGTGSTDNIVKMVMGGGGVYDTAYLRSTVEGGTRYMAGLISPVYATGVDLFHRSEVNVDSYGEASLMLRWAPNSTQMNSGNGIPAAYVKTKRTPGSTTGSLELYATEGITFNEPPTLSGTQGNWVAPTLGNSWANYGSGWVTAAYKKNLDGSVELRGLIRNGTVNVAIFTLPSGFRPTMNSIFTCLANAGAGTARVDVLTDGTVKVTSYGTGATNGLLSLNGIRFSTV